MKDNRFWCNQCKKEFQANEVEKRSVDGIWGEGRWWYCLTCGNSLQRYPEIGEEEQKIILRVKQSLVEVQEWEKICHLLIDMGQFYSKNGASRNACLVFFNASQIAEQYNLHEIATLANQLLNRKAYMFNLSGQQQEEPLKDLFERFLASYIPQWPDIE